MEYLTELINWLRTLHSDEGVRALIAWGGLSILIAIVFAETGLLAGFFLPGDSLLVTAGVVCAGAFPGLPPLNIWLTNLLLVLAAVIGDQVGYGLGKSAGRAIYKRPDTRFFKKKYLYEAQELYANKGGSSLIIARFVPVMRTFVPFIAGVAQMPYRSFVAYNVVGGVLWVTSLLWVGYLLGLSPLAEQAHRVILLVIVVSVLPCCGKSTSGGSTRRGATDLRPRAPTAPTATPGVQRPDAWRRWPSSRSACRRSGRRCSSATCPASVRGCRASVAAAWHCTSRASRCSAGSRCCRRMRQPSSAAGRSAIASAPGGPGGLRPRRRDQLRLGPRLSVAHATALLADGRAGWPCATRWWGDPGGRPCSWSA